MYEFKQRFIVQDLESGEFLCPDPAGGIAGDKAGFEDGFQCARRAGDLRRTGIFGGVEGDGITGSLQHGFLSFRFFRRPQSSATVLPLRQAVKPSRLLCRSGDGWTARSIHTGSGVP